jgi:DNA-binding transcriptional ArsR family regulator
LYNGTCIFFDYDTIGYISLNRTQLHLYLWQLLQFKIQSLLIMQHSIFDLLFPATRGRILAMLILHPDETLHVRELARRTGVAAGTIARELTRLAEVGLLKRELRGNQVAYSADTTCPIYADLANLLRKTAGLADVIADALLPISASIVVALVFGSQAAGRENAGSDVDLLVIGSATFKDVVHVTHAAQSQLGREINPKVFTPKEWLEKRKLKDAFVHEVMNNPKILLIGNLDDLTKSSRH